MPMLSDNSELLSVVIWVFITLVVYLGSLLIYRLLGSRPLFHPIIFCIAILAILLSYAEVDVKEYQLYTGLLSWLLGPATVALAIYQWKPVSS